MSDAPVFVVIGGAGMFPLALHEQTCNPGTPLDLSTPRVVKHADHLAALSAAQARCERLRAALEACYAVASLAAKDLAKAEQPWVRDHATPLRVTSLAARAALEEPKR